LVDGFQLPWLFATANTLNTKVGFENLAAMIMNNTIFWDVTPGRRLSLLFLGSLFDHEDGGSTFLQSVGKFLQSYTASHPRRHLITRTSSSSTLTDY
jgi:hypothetical protein